MNRNIRIARELVRIAKSLVAGGNVNDMMRSFIKDYPEENDSGDTFDEISMSSSQFFNAYIQTNDEYENYNEEEKYLVKRYSGEIMDYVNRNRHGNVEDRVYDGMMNVIDRYER